MTTAPALTAVDWIRLTIGDRQVTVDASPGIEPRILVTPDFYEGSLDPLTRGPAPKMRFSVDLVATEPDAMFRCEAEARRVVGALAALEPAAQPLREFSLEAALSGDGVPYNRVLAPRLTLLSDEPFALDLDDGYPEPAVRAFSARAHSDDNGAKYLMQRVD